MPLYSGMDSRRDCPPGVADPAAVEGIASLSPPPGGPLIGIAGSGPKGALA
jgi:hypothetical protein